MRKKYNALRSNTYVMQIFTLMSGTLVAQLVMLAFVPILTRLYSPAEFGVYSLFFSVSNVLGMVSSLKYDQAIMLPRSDRNALALVLLSIFITLGMVVLVGLSIFLFDDLIISYFNNLGHVIWLIPVGVFLTGFLQIFNAYSSRYQFYKQLSVVRVVNAFSVISVQIGSKYFIQYQSSIIEKLKLDTFIQEKLKLYPFIQERLKFDAFIQEGLQEGLKFDGLIIGKLLADLISLLSLIRHHFKRQTLQFFSVSRRRLIVNAKRYSHFPKYQSITVFLNAISQNIPILLLSSLYSVEIAGLYALTVRVLQAPIGLIGASTREVYYQKASKLHANDENFYNLYIKTTLGLLKIFIFPLLIVLFFGEYLFGFVFGSRWNESGVFAQILIFWFACGFINYPSIVSYSILNLQKIQMRLEVISLILRFLAIYIGYYLFKSYYISIGLFMIVSVLTNGFSIFFIKHKLKKITT
ncbi:oligosaccharide flippase family protein [Methylobacter sp. G7]|uniref:oligosaccharide flippase family protein n=1 Tax=Methylobacter sp. G7 TaxID=3230117 RepID=UPI003D8063CA